MGNQLISMLPEGLEQQVTEILKGGTGIAEDPDAPVAPIDEGTDATENGTTTTPPTPPAPVTTTLPAPV
jgi:membrane protein required for colicin V production